MVYKTSKKRIKYKKHKNKSKKKFNLLKSKKYKNILYNSECKDKKIRNQLYYLLHQVNLKKKTKKTKKIIKIIKSIINTNFTPNMWKPYESGGKPYGPVSLSKIHNNC